MLWLGYEAVVLRSLYGPQNLLFSLAHGYPHAVVSLAFVLSAVSAALLIVSSASIGLLAAFGRLQSWGRLRIYAGTIFIPIVLVFWGSQQLQKPMSLYLLVSLAALLLAAISYVVFVSVKSHTSVLRDA